MSKVGLVPQPSVPKSEHNTDKHFYRNGKCIDGSVWNGTTEPTFSNFGLDKPPRLKKFGKPEMIQFE